MPLPSGRVLLQSDTASLVLDGGSTDLFLSRMIPLLRKGCCAADLAGELVEIREQDILAHLEALTEGGILSRYDPGQGGSASEERHLDPLLRLVDTLGLPVDAAIDRLRDARVAVFGVEGPGAETAALLCRSGVGRLVLVDPFPCTSEGVPLLPGAGAACVGTPREDVVQRLLERQVGNSSVRTSGVPLSRASVADLAAQCDLLIGCFDRGFLAAHHWINRASQQHAVPALFSEAWGHRWLAGPLVIPGKTACFMCYRMRSVACADDFEAAMRYEEYLDRTRVPSLHERALPPAASAYLASQLAMEAVKYLLRLEVPSLAGRVLEFDSLSIRQEIHGVLKKPDCPVCRLPPDRHQPSLTGLLAPPDRRGDVLSARPWLVSGRTGVVREEDSSAGDPGDPPRPLLGRALLSNHLFLPGDEALHRVSSGKGMTLEETIQSTLGEAVERYSSRTWDPTEVTFARRGDLDATSLDPAELVLYAAPQYQELGYTPYDGNNILGWVPARSLATGGVSLVPALAVYLNYRPRSREEHLFPITSNGLATGPTLLDAVLAATLEVLERDAFLVTWMNRLPCTSVDPQSHPDPEVRELVSAFARRRVDVRLFHLPTDHAATVFAAFGIGMPGGDGPAAVLGLGADLDPARAARRALLELAQVRRGLRQQLRWDDTRRRVDELAGHPERVRTMDDHALLFASPETLAALSFLLDRPQEAMSWQSPVGQDARDQLPFLLSDLSGRGHDVLYCDLSPPDMRGLGLWTARAIVPGFQPIHFGAAEARLGGTRLYRLPTDLKLRPGPEAFDLNLHPHPLA